MMKSKNFSSFFFFFFFFFVIRLTKTLSAFLLLIFISLLSFLILQNIVESAQDRERIKFNIYEGTCDGFN